MKARLLSDIVDKKLLNEIDIDDVICDGKEISVIPIPNSMYKCLPSEIKNDNKTLFIVNDDFTYDDIIKQIRIDAILGKPVDNEKLAEIYEKAIQRGFDSIYIDDKYATYLESEEVRITAEAAKKSSEANNNDEIEDADESSNEQD